jgi:GrpB-like predicted nucleotidyltransferase (UPF0157 family)
MRDLVQALLAHTGYRLMILSPTAAELNKGYTEQGYAPEVFHIHLRYLGDCDELYFRDYLMSHRETIREYAWLKRRLAGLYEHDRDRYTKEKTSFIRHYSELAKLTYRGRY